MFRYHFFVPFFLMFSSANSSAIKPCYDEQYLLHDLTALKDAFLDIEDQHAAQVIEGLSPELLQGYLGYDATLQTRTYTVLEKKFIGRYLAHIFTHCPWLTHVNLANLDLLYVPSSIGLLQHLHELDVSENRLKHLPAEIGDLPKLVAVKIKGNPLAAVSVSLFKFFTAPLALAQMTTFTRGHGIMKKRHQEVEDFFRWPFKSLKNQLWDEMAEGFIGIAPNGTRKPQTDQEKKFIYRNLVKICANLSYVTHVNLSGFGYKNMPLCLTELPFLQHLDVGDNDMTVIPSEIDQMQALRYFDASNNNIPFFPKALEKCQNLEYIDFSRNQTILIPKEMAEMPKLTYVDFSRNALSSLGPIDKYFPNLCKLYIHDNRLTRLPDALMDLPYLHTLVVYNNPLKSLQGKLAPKIKDMPGDELQKLIAVHHREEQINILMSLATGFDASVLKEELARGCIGVTEAGQYRHLTMPEKDFIMMYFEEIFAAFPWLVDVNLERMALMLIPAGLKNCTQLRFLNLGHNYLKDLPDFVGEFTQLVALNLQDNEFETLPSCVWALANMQSLKCDTNLLRTLDPAICKLKNLTELSLTKNFLKALPDELFNLTQLKKLILNDNQLACLSPLIGNLTELESLNIGQNQLEILPVQIGLLGKLKKLTMRHSRVKRLPFSLLALHNFEELSLEKHSLSYKSADSGMGLKEIKEHFEKILKMSIDPDTRNIDIVSEQQLYAELDKNALRWNREALSHIKLPEIPHVDFTCQSLMADWAQIWAQVNIDKPDQPVYIDYYTLLQKTPVANEKLDNQQLMTQRVVPKLNGFMKSLCEIPLSKEDQSGWVMQPRQLALLRHIIAFIFDQLKRCNPDQFYTIFMQFASGALACQTGQKTNFETILLSLLNQNGAQKAQIAENFDRQLLAFLAEEKERLFTIIMNDVNNLQSVHLLDHYKSFLHDRLGLSLMIKNFKDIHGIQGNDRFGGSLGNALQAFYDVFTPSNFIRSVLARIATDDDLAARRKLSKSVQEKQAIEQSKAERPFTLRDIVTHMMDQKLLTPDDVDEDEFQPGTKAWRYFTTAKMDKLTPLAIEDILVKMGMLVRGEVKN